MTRHRRNLAALGGLGLLVVTMPLRARAQVEAPPPSPAPLAPPAAESGTTATPPAAESGTTAGVAESPPPATEGATARPVTEEAQAPPHTNQAGAHPGVGAPETATVSHPATCVLGNHDGIPDADARTAMSLVCGELAQRHPQADGIYRVGLGKLGNVTVLSLSQESTDGTVIAHRQINLSSIEEVTVGAPRIVEALLENKPLAQTETVDNLVGDDVRPTRRRSGDTNVALGVVGLFAPSAGPETSVGLDLAFVYEASQFAIGLDVRFAARAAEAGVGMFATGPFGRFFLTNTDVAPFLGAGLGPLMLDVVDQDLSDSRWGFCFWGEAGVELMRTHRSQLSAGTRVNVPAYQMEDEESSGFVPTLEIFSAFHFD